MKRALIYVLIVTTMVCALERRSWAMLAPAQTAAEASAPGLDRARDMKTVQAALESKIVRQRLKDLGLSDEEIQARVQKLSDKEVHQLAMQVHALSAGGDGGIIVGLLVIAVLVLLVVFLAKRI